MPQEAEPSMPPNCWYCIEPLAAKQRAAEVQASAERMAVEVAKIDPGLNVEHYEIMLKTLTSLEETASILRSSEIESISTWSSLSRRLKCPGPIISDVCTLELRKEL